MLDVGREYGDYPCPPLPPLPIIPSSVQQRGINTTGLWKCVSISQM